MIDISLSIATQTKPWPKAVVTVCRLKRPSAEEYIYVQHIYVNVYTQRPKNEWRFQSRLKLHELNVKCKTNFHYQCLLNMPFNTRDLKILVFNICLLKTLHYMTSVLYFRKIWKIQILIMIIIIIIKILAIYIW